MSSSRFVRIFYGFLAASGVYGFDRYSTASRQFLGSSSGVPFCCSPSVQSDNLQPQKGLLHLFAACLSLFPRCSSWAARKPTNQRRKTPRENNSLLGFAAPQEQKRSRSTFLFRDSETSGFPFLGRRLSFSASPAFSRYREGGTREGLHGYSAHTQTARLKAAQSDRRGAGDVLPPGNSFEEKKRRTARESSSNRAGVLSKRGGKASPAARPAPLLRSVRLCAAFLRLRLVSLPVAAETAFCGFWGVFAGSDITFDF